MIQSGGRFFNNIFIELGMPMSRAYLKCFGMERIVKSG